MYVLRDISVQTVREACPVGNCPATMAAAAHLPPGGHVAAACQAMAAPSVSTVALRDVPPNHAAMEGFARKRPAILTSAANVLRTGLGNGVSTSRLCFRCPRVLCQTAIAKPMTASVIRNATHLLAAGMEGIAPWQWTPGPIAQTPCAGMSSTTASVMRPATTKTVCMTTLTAETKKKFAS